jgi:hypothetical protein
MPTCLALGPRVRGDERLIQSEERTTV